VADRVRMAPARKRGSGRRPAKSKRMRRLGIFGLFLLAALILGFLTKRIMIPSAVHYIAYRPPDQSQTTQDANPPATSDTTENLTPGDRRQLDEIIKHKAR
jgi:hypothetical protein